MGAPDPDLRHTGPRPHGAGATHDGAARHGHAPGCNHHHHHGEPGSGHGGGMPGHDHDDHAPGAHRHHHHHAHHHHAPPDSDSIFALSVALNLGYAALEAGFGLATGSLGLIADAGHNLSDVLSLLLAWGAIRLARRPPTPRRSYGWSRATILAALANAILLLVAVGGIGIEAVQRLFEPRTVATGTVVGVAAIGVVVNGGTALLLMRGGGEDLNVRGAVAHMLADAAVTVGVILAALLMGATGWYWVDPVIALAIAALILAGTWPLLRASTALAMDMVPDGIDPQAVTDWLAARPGVTGVHDLHIWAPGTTDVALTVHLVRPAHGPDDAFLRAACQGLRERFGIGHATIQVEAGDPAHPCPQAPTDVL